MTEKITTEAELIATIALLENQVIEEGQELKTAIVEAYDKMQPLKLLSSFFENVLQSDETKDQLVNTGIALVCDLVSKAMFEKEHHSQTRKFVGTALQFGVTQFIAQNPTAFRSITTKIFNFFKK